MRDVVVVGAGPAGSAVATALAQQGWDVLLMERDRFPRHKVCGEFLSPEAQTSLAALGLADAVTAVAPTCLTHATITSPHEQVLRAPLPGLAWGVSRYALDAALATTTERQGVEVWNGSSVKTFTATADHYKIELHAHSPEGTAPRPTTVAARALIMACGRHSATTLPPHPLPHTRALSVGIKGHYADLAMPAQVELYCLPGGYAGLNPVEGGRVNLCLLLSYAAFQRTGQSVPAVLAALATWNPALGRRLNTGRLLPETVRTVAPVDTGRPAAPWADVACLGDTAVMLPPLCGDGMAMALRSAELCAPLADDFLRGRQTLTEWATTYVQQWQREFNRRVQTGRLLEWLLAASLPADAFIGLGRVAPPLVRYLITATRGSAHIR